MPAISVRCPGCRKRLAAPVKAVGRTLKCPNCKAPVTVPADGDNTVVDENAPDFSYLRNQSDDDDILTATDDAEDGESALGQSTARRPAAPTVVAKPTIPPPVVYTPVAAAVPPPPASVPFTEPADPPLIARQKRTAEPEPEPETTVVTRTPVWVWPVLAALILYGLVATGLGAWGWLRPTDPPPVRTTR